MLPLRWAQDWKAANNMGKARKEMILQWKQMGAVSPQKVGILVGTWKITFLSTPRHLRPLSLCSRHHLHHSTASTFTEGRQQHLLAQGLINWLIRRPRCKLIDWSSCGRSCLYLEPWGVNLWRSPVICHVQHTGEDEEADEELWVHYRDAGGMYGGSLSQDGNRGLAKRTMGT